MRRALVVALIALAPASASAWTDAAVRSVHAEVRVDEQAQAHVTVTATVRVHGGWLEGLEIAGLDPDLVLDEAYEVWAEGSDGERYVPRLTLSHERVQIAFRGHSPRRGEVRIGFAYRTSLAHRATAPVEGEDRVRVTWTLPGWRAGLDGVEVDLYVPTGSVAGPQDVELGRGAEMSLRVEELDGQAVFHHWRAHLPRTVPWTVSADVPAEAMDPGLRGAPVVHLPPPPPSAALGPDQDPTPFWMFLPAVLALLALAQIVFVARRARRAGVGARPLLYAPALIRAVGVLVAAPSAAWLGIEGLELPAIAALVVVTLCAAHLRGERPAASKLGAWRPVDARWLRAARRARWGWLLHPASLLDVTTPLGALHAAAWLAAPWLAPSLPVTFDVALLAAVLPAPIFLTGTRLAFTRPATDSLASLLSFARHLKRLPEGVALRPVMHVSADGDVQDVRLRTVLEHRPDGLLRLDVAIAHRGHAGGWSAAPVWLVLTRADSPADAALAALGLDGDASRGGRRVVRCVEIEDAMFLDRVVAALADCPAARVVPRGVAAPLETVRDLPAPRAVGF